MSERGEQKDQKQDRAIASLLSSESIRDAAKQAGVSEATLHRWLKDEAFQVAYRAAKREVVDHAVCQLQRSTGKAVKALVEIVEDKKTPASARVSAIKTILEMSIKSIEIEDLEDRITNLESILRTQKKQ